MGKKTPPWPAYPQWTTARYRAFVRSNVRKMHTKWPPFREAQAAGRRDKPSDVPGRHKFEHQCEHCKQWFPIKQIELDHRTPCGSIMGLGENIVHEDIGPFIERMLAPVEGYIKLCLDCHQKVTNEERSSST